MQAGTDSSEPAADDAAPTDYVDVLQVNGLVDDIVVESIIDAIDRVADDPSSAR